MVFSNQNRVKNVYVMDKQIMLEAFVNKLHPRPASSSGLELLWISIKSLLSWLGILMKPYGEFSFQQFIHFLTPSVRDVLNNSKIMTFICAKCKRYCYTAWKLVCSNPLNSVREPWPLYHDLYWNFLFINLPGQFKLFDRLI